jgi:hypothetical protein
MKFNRFILDNYLNTSEGKEALEFFTNFWLYFKNADIETIQKFLQNQYLVELKSENITNFVQFILKNTHEKFEDSKEFFIEERNKITSIEIAEEYFDIFIKETMEIAPNLKMRELCTCIEGISLVLHFIKPDFYFPYFFVDYFFKVELIFTEFGIPLPPIPSKMKYKERLYYYFELCRALYEFRTNNDLSYIELNILLYFFAKNIIENIDIREEGLLEPTKVYISGATKEDCTETIKKSK